MRDENGFEVLAVTHRVELPTEGGIERFALSWRAGFWHEPIERNRVSRHDGAKAPACRDYRPTDPPSGVQIEHEATPAGIIIRISVAMRGKGQMEGVDSHEVVLPPHRDSWHLESVHASGSRTYSLISEGRVAVVWAKCSECGAQRNFPLGIWRTLDASLGCYRCTRRGEPTVNNQRQQKYLSADEVPPTHGMYHLLKVVQTEQENAGQPPKLVIWGKCTGGSCSGHVAAFTPHRWASEERQMGCPACRRPPAKRMLSPEQRAAVAALTFSGRKATEVAAEFGVAAVTIYKIFDKARFEKRCADHEAYTSQQPMAAEVA